MKNTTNEQGNLQATVNGTVVDTEEALLRPMVQCSCCETKEGYNAQPLTKAAFKALTTRQDVVEKIADIRQLVAEGKLEEANELKLTLPVFVFGATFEPGTQRNSNNPTMQRSTLGYIDIDGISPQDSARELYDRLVDAGLLKKEQVALAHVTPRGGLHIVVVRSGRTMAEVQEDFQRNWGALIESYGKLDRKPKDPARGSFVVTADDIILQADDLLWPTIKRYNELMAMDRKDNRNTQSVPKTEEAPVESEVAEGEVQSEFEGIPLEDIYRELIVKKNGSLPTTAGNRNNLLFEAGCQLSTICECDEHALREAARKVGGEMGLSKDEVDATIRSVAKTVREDRPMQAKLLKECIKALKKTMTVTDRDSVTEKDITELPAVYKQFLNLKLPPVIAQYARLYVDLQKKVVVVNACLPLLGTAFGKLVSRYIDRSLQYPVFQVIVEGNSSDGKSCVKQVEEDLLKYVDEHDAEEGEKELRYQRQRSRWENGKLEEEPDDPKAIRQNVSTTTSASQIRQRAANSQGLVLLQMTNEVDNLAKNNRKGAWGVLTDLWREGYENDFTDQDYVNKDTYNGRTNIKLGYLACGTPRKVNRLFMDPEDGCVQRAIFTTMGNQAFKSLEVPKELTPKERDIIDYHLCRARYLSYKEDGSAQDDYVLDLPWLNKEMNNWLEEKKLESITSPYPESMDTFRRRAAVNGFRAGMLSWVLWEENPRHKKDVIAFARWIAEYALWRAMVKFGETYQKIRDGQNVVTTLAQGKQGNILEVLGEEFTRAEFYAEAEKLGTTNGDAKRKMLNRMLQAKYIVRTADADIFRKVA